MVFATLTRLTLKSLVFLVVAAAVIIFLPGLPPNIKFESFNVTPPIKLESNNILDKAELLASGKFIGAETVTGSGDVIYTGVLGGNILQYKNGKIKVIANTGTKQCIVATDHENCGHPLGLRFRENLVWVADANKGILTVNPETGVVKPVYPQSQSIDGRAAIFADDLDLTKDGTTIYWSDASQYTFTDAIKEYFGNEPSGRLIKFDRKAKTNTVLINNICFANGVQLSQNEDFVLVAETMRARILRYHLKGPKAGTRDIFIDGLPGLPDNIRSSGRGTFYIGLVSAREDVLDRLSTLPWLRKLIIRTRELLLMSFLPFELLMPNNPIVKEWKLYVADLGALTQPNDPAFVVEVDESGKIVSSFQGKRVRQISTMSVVGSYAYLGTPFSKKLWRIKVSELK